MHPTALLVDGEDQRDTVSEVLQLGNAAPDMLGDRALEQDAADAAVTCFLDGETERALTQRSHDRLSDPDRQRQLCCAPLIDIGPPRPREQLANPDTREPTQRSFLTGEHGRSRIADRYLAVVSELQPHAKRPGRTEARTDDMGMDRGLISDDRQDGGADGLDRAVGVDHPVAHAARSAQHCHDPGRRRLPI